MMNSERSITKLQLVLAAIGFLVAEGIAIWTAIPMLHMFDLSPVAVWSSVGILAAAPLGVVTIVWKPSPKILSRRRETALIMLAVYVLFPAWALIVVLCIGLKSIFHDYSQLVFVFCMLAAFCAAPLVIYLHLLDRYRISYYASRCTKCLYDLTAVEAGNCPECNTPIIREADLSTQSSHPAHSQADPDTDPAAPP